MTLHELDSFIEKMATQDISVVAVKMPKHNYDDFVESCRAAASVPDDKFMEVSEYRGVSIQQTFSDNLTYEIKTNRKGGLNITI